MPETDIYRSYNFVVDLGGVQLAYFTEVSGLSISVESIPYREGGAGLAVRLAASGRGDCHSFRESPHN